MKRSILIASLIAASAVLVACGSMGDKNSFRGDKGQQGKFKAARQASPAACKGKAEGDKVTVKGMNGENVTALCMEMPQGRNKDMAGKLHAVPEQMIERFKAAKAACTGKSEGDSVQLTGKGTDSIAATCVKRDNELVARPNRMNNQSMHRMMRPAKDAVQK